MDKDLLSEVFERVIYPRKDTQEIEKRLEREIHKLMEPYAEKFTDEEKEVVIGMMYAAELKSMRAGFRQGVKCAVELLVSLLKKS